MAKTGMACCENCSSVGIHCYNGDSPSCGGYCGEYPGTGPWSSTKDKEKKGDDK